MDDKIFFKNSKGNRLCGFLSNPIGDKSRPIMVLCHGFNSNKNASTLIVLQSILNEKNIATFRFDFFGHGESGGNFEDLTQSESVDDALQAIKFVKGLGYKKIGLFGSSFGGLAVIMAASQTKDIYLLALKAPVSSYFEFTEYKYQKLLDEWKEKGYAFREGKKLNYTFYEDIKNNIAYDVAYKIKAPVLIVHGDSDADVPIEQSKKLSKLISNCQLKIIGGASHRFDEGNSRQLMIAALTDFIVKYSK